MLLTRKVKVVDQKRGNAVMIEGVVFSIINNQPCRDKGWNCLTVSKAGWTGQVCRDFPVDEEFDTICDGEL